jgi:hypothetical protein
MAAFSATAFSTSAFSVLAWDFGSITPPVTVQPSLQGGTGGIRVLFTYDGQRPKEKFVPWDGRMNTENQDRADLAAIMDILFRSGVL